MRAPLSGVGHSSQEPLREQPVVAAPSEGQLDGALVQGSKPAGFASGPHVALPCGTSGHGAFAGLVAAAHKSKNEGMHAVLPQHLPREQSFTSSLSSPLPLEPLVGDSRVAPAGSTFVATASFGRPASATAPATPPRSWLAHGLGLGGSASAPASAPSSPGGGSAASLSLSTTTTGGFESRIARLEQMQRQRRDGTAAPSGTGAPSHNAASPCAASPLAASSCAGPGEANRSIDSPLGGAWPSLC